MSYAGVIDAINMACRFLATLFLLVRPVNKLKRAYLIFSCLETLSFVVIASSHWVPVHHTFLIGLGTIWLGFGGGIPALPYMIAFENLHGAENPALMDTWFSLSALGDAYGLLTSLLVIYVLQWNWSFALLLYSLFFLASSIAESFLKEVRIQQQPVSLPSIAA